MLLSTTNTAPARIAENVMLGRWARLLPRHPGQLNSFNESDAELVPLGDGRILAATIDTVEEEIRTGLYADGHLAGKVAAVAALSDLAAVGADPVGLLLSVGLPCDAAGDVQAEVARGVAEVCARAGTFVLGGDTGEAPGLSIACVGLGLVPEGEFLTRRGARPGDRVFASAPLGAGAAFAAARLLADNGAAVAFDPVPRLRQGRALRAIASACMDTSDGAIATLDQIARLNGVGIDLDVDLRAAICPDAMRVALAHRLPPLSLLAAHHGEFELVFTVAADRLQKLHAAATDWSPIPLGYVSERPGIRIHGRALDSAAIRNLAAHAGRAPAAYARGLVALCGGAVPTTLPLLTRGPS